VGSIVPLHALVVHQAQVGFIHQSCRLQAVAGAFPFHVATCQTVEFAVNGWGQPFERRLVSVPPGAEKSAYVVHSRSRGCMAYARIIRCRESLKLQPGG
jgi:hypothetical protein